ncbi:B12-binding domain-containing radical SAM protein [Candidatus Altiarchaeota archaeon]
MLLLNPPAEQKYVKESRCQHRAAVFQSVYPPLTLASMAGLIRGAHEVRLIDAMGADLSRDYVEKQTMSFNPDLVVVNTSTPTALNDLEIIEELKNKTSKTKFVIFGVTASYFAHDLIKKPFLDAVIVGEPEYTVFELAKEENWRKVNGLVFKDDRGEIYTTPRREMDDANYLPVPAWDLVDLSYYRMPVTNERYVLVATGRGCPYRCTFCVSPSYYGMKFRTKKVGQVIKEIKFAQKQGVNSFFFFVETFTLDKSYVKDLCREIVREKLNIKWVCNSRVDTVDFEMLSVMREAGCQVISFGIETGSQEILDNAKKKIRLEQSMKAVELARKAGLATVGHFIFGLPGETEETIKETLAFSKKLPLHFAEFYIATPYPGSELFESLEIKSFNDVDWTRFEYSNNVIDQGLNLEKAHSRAYLGFYLRPRVMLDLIRFYGLGRLPSLINTGFHFIRGILG